MANESPLLTEVDFKKLSRPANAVLTWRMAMRVQPLLVRKSSELGFWPKADRGKRLAALLTGLDAVLLMFYMQDTGGSRATTRAHDAFAFAGDISDAFSANTVLADADADATYAVNAAVDAAYTYTIANTIAYPVNTASAVDAANTSVATDASASMYWDYDRLLVWQKSIKNEKDPVPPTTIIFSPLWQTATDDEQKPEGWGEIVARWRKVLSSYGHDAFAEAYVGLLVGQPWDIEASWQRVEAWCEDYQPEQQEKKVEKNKAKASRAETKIFPDTVEPEPLVSSNNTVRLGGMATPTYDRPTAEDALGRKALVKSLAAILEYEKYSGRMTVGLLGHWGAGKSSVLDMLVDVLKKDEQQSSKNPVKGQYICATFNAWAYEHTDNIQAGLAQEVVNGLTHKLSVRQRLDLAERFALKTEPRKYLATLLVILGVWLLVVWFICQGQGMIAAIGAAFVSLAAYWRNMKTVFSHPLAESLKTYLKLPSFGKHLGTLPIIKEQVEILCDLVLCPKVDVKAVAEKRPNGKLQTWLDKFVRRGCKEKRFLFMVDDLDRCGVGGVVKTLEAVRLVMDLPNVTTIVAIDHRMALAALSVHYSELADKGSHRTAHAIARDYLGKIFNLPIQLDTPGEPELNQFVDKVLFKDIQKGEEKNKPSVAPNVDQLKDDDIIELPEPEKIISEGIENVDSEEEQDPASSKLSKLEKQLALDDGEDTIADSDGVQEAITDTEYERDHFCKLASYLNIVNPRQLMRLHNSYRLLKALAYNQNDGVTEGDRGLYIQLMTTLFWLEHISCLDNKQRAFEEKVLFSAKAESSRIPELLDQTYTLVHNGMRLNDEGEEGYKRLKKKVKIFMLPYADITENVDEKSS